MNNSKIAPVLLLIFNRPDKVRSLMQALSKVKPPKIYVSADGPRKNVKGEEDLCLLARSVAMEPSWPCEVVTNFVESNVGCKAAVSGGISWFFQQEDEGIILEDDCVPDKSFFRFCGDLLEKYRDDEDIFHINGTVFLDDDVLKRKGSSYYYSKIPHVWGWATWARAWKYFDPEMEKRSDLIGDHNHRLSFPKKKHAKYWPGLFDHVYSKKVDSWAVPWTYSVMSRGGICLAPTTNLVHNIGFDGEATHTRDTVSISPEAKKIAFPLIHPTAMTGDTDLDAMVMERIFIKSLWQRVKNKAQLWYNQSIKRLLWRG